jgi:hypothetical protein
MSADGSVILPFGDDDHRFRLGIGELRELQQTVNEPRVKAGVDPVGPAQLLYALGTNAWWVDDAREILRIGLIGGGLAAPKALMLVKRYVEQRPSRENLPVARRVLLAALIGVPEDPVGGKNEAEMAPSKATSASLSPLSTASEVPLDGQPET